MSYIKDIIHRNSVLFKNTASLSVLQIANYIFPLITLPYLVRVLGPEKFGLINFALAFTGYFQIIVDYGFNLSATKKISQDRSNKDEIEIIYSTILVNKLILFLLSSVLFFPLIYFVKFFNQDFLLYVITFAGISGNIFFPQWLFQGLEKMKYITNITILVRSLSVAAVFIFVKEETDMLNYAILNSVTQLVIGLISLLVVSFLLKYKYRKTTLKYIRKEFIEGWYFFVSTISITLYTITNTFILGLFAGNTVVGYYSAADKIRIAVQSVYSAITQSLYPHLSYLFKTSYDKALSKVEKALKLISVSSFIICLLLFIFADNVVYIVLGSSYHDSILILRLICFLPFIIMSGNIIGVQVMLNNGYEKDFMRVIIIGAIINLILSFTLVPLFGVIGTAISVIIAESIITVLFFSFVYKKGIFSFNV